MRILHGNGGGEFKNCQLDELFRAKGILYEDMVPDTPQLNGSAERANRLLGEKMRSLLFDTGLPKALWGEAIKAASMIINLLPTSTQLYGYRPHPGSKPLTPFEAWMGVQPDARWIHCWSCDAYVKDLKNTSKLESRTKKFKFVGYQGFNVY